VENRLVSVTKGTHRSEFEYDPLGRRSRIIEKDTNGQGGWTTGSDKRYLWEGAEIVEEEAADGSTLKAFYGQGFVDTDGTALMYATDQLGSIRELVDMQGSVRARYDYDPYGRVTKIAGDRDSLFLYAGYLWHAQSGLDLTLFRAYDPNFGRWISRDPLKEKGGINLYGYVGNNPVNWWDPYGLVGEPFVLPPNPSAGMPRGWAKDMIHRDPNGEIWRSPNGKESLEFNKGRPGLPGWRGKDHWHQNDDHEDHLKPGTEVEICDQDPVPDPEPAPAPAPEKASERRWRMPDVPQPSKEQVAAAAGITWGAVLLWAAVVVLLPVGL
jgi:RHS repeat-associated protein